MVAGGYSRKFIFSVTIYMSYDENAYKTFSCGEKIPCLCDACGNKFERIRREITIMINRRQSITFCSKKCYDIYQDKSLELLCKTCNKLFSKKQSQFKKTKNHFCSSSCAATFNNTNKTHGYRRSKLEVWLETELTKLYPNLEFHFNRKDTINSELDIYIPSLKLAFELNGIFHYEPIYGQETLDKINNNDNRKFLACHENNISLCIIDTSQQKYVKPSTSQKYLDIITNLVNLKLSKTDRVEVL